MRSPRLFARAAAAFRADPRGMVDLLSVAVGWLGAAAYLSRELYDYGSLHRWRHISLVVGAALQLTFLEVRVLRLRKSQATQTFLFVGERLLALERCVYKRATELAAERDALATQAHADGILLPGWHCEACRGFNGSVKEVLPHCRGCGAPRPSEDRP